MPLGCCAEILRQFTASQTPPVTIWG